MSCLLKGSNSNNKEVWNCNYYKCFYNHPKWIAYCLTCKRFYEGLKHDDELPILLDRYEDFNNIKTEDIL